MCVYVCVTLQSGGEFKVTISGSGSVTLSDINACASELAPYIRDPVNWATNANFRYHFTNFLGNSNPVFLNLSACAALYVSTSDHLLTLYASGWVCPSSTGAVVGAASQQVFVPLFSVGFTMALGWIIQLLLIARRQ